MAFPSEWVPVVSPGGVWNPKDTPTDWEEVIDLEQPGGGKMLSKDDGTATLVGTIPAAKEYDAQLKILGCAWADSGAPYYLHRYNALPHPFDLQLRASSLEMVGMNPMGKDQGGGAYKPLNAAPYLTGLPTDPNGDPATRLPGTGNYSRLKTTIKFRPVNYPVLEESEMDDGGTRISEVYRNCVFFDSCDPQLDVILADGDPFLEWADTATAGAPQAGDQIASQTPEFVQRANLVALWVGVPWEYVIDPAGYLPTKLMNAVGKVNDAEWYGFPAGTLRFEAPKFRQYVQAPVRVVPPNYYLPIVYDIQLSFSWVNPTAAAVVGGVPSGGGWNLYPFSRTGKYYAVRRVTSHDPYFAGYDFDKLFEHVSKP